MSSIPRSGSTTIVTDAAFLSFSEIAGSRMIEAILGTFGVHSGVLSSTLGGGIDTALDRAIAACGSISMHAPIMARLFEWRAAQHKTIAAAKDAVHVDLAQRLGNKKDAASTVRDSRFLAADFLFCRMLIELLSRNADSLGEARANSIEEIAMSFLLNTEAIYTRPIGREVVDLYAKVLGVLSHSHFNSVRKCFLRILRESSTGTHALARVVRGMRYFHLPLFPIQALEDSFEFLQDVAKFFVELRKSDVELRSAYAALFTDLLVPLAATVNSEVNVPCVRSFVEELFKNSLDALKKTKQSQALFPLITALLCLSQKRFFVEHWTNFVQHCLVALKQHKDTAMVRIAVESLWRLLWVYVVRLKGEGSATTLQRLKAIVDVLFSKGNKAVVLRDIDTDVLVDIISFIAAEKPDFALREIVLELFQVKAMGRSSIVPERAIIGLRAFLAIVNSRLNKSGAPLFPGAHSRKGSISQAAVGASTLSTARTPGSLGQSGSAGSSGAGGGSVGGGTGGGGAVRRTAAGVGRSTSSAGGRSVGRNPSQMSAMTPVFGGNVAGSHFGTMSRMTTSTLDMLGPKTATAIAHGPILTAAAADEIGLRDYMVPFLNSFGYLLRTLDATVGHVFLMSNVSLRQKSSSASDSERRPFVELFRVAIECLPRFIPPDMAALELLLLLVRMSIHIDADVRGAAYTSMKRIIASCPNLRSMVVRALAAFVLDGINITDPLVVEGVLRMIVQLLHAWTLAEIADKQMRVIAQRAQQAKSVPQQTWKDTRGRKLKGGTSSSVLSSLENKAMLAALKQGSGLHLAGGANATADGSDGASSSDVKWESGDGVSWEDTASSVEALAIVMICSTRPISRRLGLHILRELRSLEKQMVSGDDTVFDTTTAKPSSVASAANLDTANSSGSSAGDGDGARRTTGRASHQRNQSLADRIVLADGSPNAASASMFGGPTLKPPQQSPSKYQATKSSSSSATPAPATGDLVKDDKLQYRSSVMSLAGDHSQRSSSSAIADQQHPSLRALDCIDQYAPEMIRVLRGSLVHTGGGGGGGGGAAGNGGGSGSGILNTSSVMLSMPSHVQRQTAPISRLSHLSSTFLSVRNFVTQPSGSVSHMSTKTSGNMSGRAVESDPVALSHASSAPLSASAAAVNMSTAAAVAAANTYASASGSFGEPLLMANTGPSGANSASVAAAAAASGVSTGGASTVGSSTGGGGLGGGDTGSAVSSGGGVGAGSGGGDGCESSDVVSSDSKLGPPLRYRPPSTRSRVVSAPLLAEIPNVGSETSLTLPASVARRLATANTRRGLTTIGGHDNVGNVARDRLMARRDSFTTTVAADTPTTFFRKSDRQHTSESDSDTLLSDYGRLFSLLSTHCRFAMRRAWREMCKRLVALQPPLTTLSTTFDPAYAGLSHAVAGMHDIHAFIPKGSRVEGSKTDKRKSAQVPATAQMDTTQEWCTYALFACVTAHRIGDTGDAFPSATTSSGGGTSAPTSRSVPPSPAGKRNAFLGNSGISTSGGSSGGSGGAGSVGGVGASASATIDQMVNRDSCAMRTVEQLYRFLLPFLVSSSELISSSIMCALMFTEPSHVGLLVCNVNAVLGEAVLRDRVSGSSSKSSRRRDVFFLPFACLIAQLCPTMHCEVAANDEDLCLSLCSYLDLVFPVLDMLSPVGARQDHDEFRSHFCLLVETMSLVWGPDSVYHQPRLFTKKLMQQLHAIVCQWCPSIYNAQGVAPELVTTLANTGWVSVMPPLTQGVSADDLPIGMGDPFSTSPDSTTVGNSMNSSVGYGNSLSGGGGGNGGGGSVKTRRRVESSASLASETMLDLLTVRRVDLSHVDRLVQRGEGVRMPLITVASQAVGALLLGPPLMERMPPLAWIDNLVASNFLLAVRLYVSWLRHRHIDGLARELTSRCADERLSPLQRSAIFAAIADVIIGSPLVEPVLEGFHPLETCVVVLLMRGDNDADTRVQAARLLALLDVRLPDMIRRYLRRNDSTQDASGNDVGAQDHAVFCDPRSDEWPNDEAHYDADPVRLELPEHSERAQQLASKRLVSIIPQACLVDMLEAFSSHFCQLHSPELRNEMLMCMQPWLSVVDLSLTAVLDCILCFSLHAHLCDGDFISSEQLHAIWRIVMAAGSATNVQLLTHTVRCCEAGLSVTMLRRVFALMCGAARDSSEILPLVSVLLRMVPLPGVITREHNDESELERGTKTKETAASSPGERSARANHAGRRHPNAASSATTSTTPSKATAPMTATAAAADTAAAAAAAVTARRSFVRVDSLSCDSQPDEEPYQLSTTLALLSTANPSADLQYKSSARSIFSSHDSSTGSTGGGGGGGDSSTLGGGSVYGRGSTRKLNPMSADAVDGPPLTRGDYAMFLLLDVLSLSVDLEEPLRGNIAPLVHRCFLNMDHERDDVAETSRQLLTGLLRKLVLSPRFSGSSSTGTGSGREDNSGRYDQQGEHSLFGGLTTTLVEAAAEALPHEIISKLFPRAERPWEFQDVSAKRLRIASAAQVSQMAVLVAAAIPGLRQDWFVEAHRVAVVCSDRHYAARSLQVLRGLDGHLTGQALGDMLARLSVSIVDASEDARGYAIEMLVTLEMMAERISEHPQVFWAAVAVMDSDHEAEFLLAVKLLTRILQLMSTAERWENIFQLASQLEWHAPPYFDGVQNMTLKGLTSPVTRDATITLLSHCTSVCHEPFMDTIHNDGFLYNFAALVPYLAEEYIAPDTERLETARRLITACKLRQVNNVAKMLFVYERCTYPRSDEEWVEQLCRFLGDACMRDGKNVFPLLREILTNGDDHHRRFVLVMMATFLRYCGLAGFGEDETNAVLKHLQGDLHEYAAHVLQLVLEKSKQKQLHEQLNRPPSLVDNEGNPLVPLHIPAALDPKRTSSWAQPIQSQRRTRERLAHVVRTCGRKPAPVNSTTPMFRSSLRLAATSSQHRLTGDNTTADAIIEAGDDKRTDADEAIAEWDDGDEIDDQHLFDFLDDELNTRSSLTDDTPVEGSSKASTVAPTPSATPTAGVNASLLAATAPSTGRASSARDELESRHSRDAALESPKSLHRALSSLASVSVPRTHTDNSHVGRNTNSNNNDGPPPLEDSVPLPRDLLRPRLSGPPSPSISVKSMPNAPSQTMSASMPAIVHDKGVAGSSSMLCATQSESAIRHSTLMAPPAGARSPSPNPATLIGTRVSILEPLTSGHSSPGSKEGGKALSRTSSAGENVDAQMVPLKETWSSSRHDLNMAPVYQITDDCSDVTVCMERATAVSTRADLAALFELFSRAFALLKNECGAASVACGDQSLASLLENVNVPEISLGERAVSSAHLQLAPRLGDMALSLQSALTSLRLVSVESATTGEPRIMQANSLRAFGHVISATRVFGKLAQTVASQCPEECSSQVVLLESGKGDDGTGHAGSLRARLMQILECANVSASQYEAKAREVFMS